MTWTNLGGQVRVGVRPAVTAQQLQTATYLLNSYGGAAVAYSLRKLNSTYVGSAIRVRRISDNAEQNIGFDGSGNLDQSGLNSFIDPVDTSVLLDVYSGASIAYSVRRLSSTYTGSAIRVRRSSDNLEQNIGFDAGGNLDTGALTAFVGSGDGFVTTWYDQSGSGNNCFQTSASAQPQIVSAGVIITRNSKPYIEATSSRYFQFTTELSSSSDYSLWMTYEKSNTANNAVLLKDGGNYLWLDYGTAQYFSNFGNFSIGIANSANVLYLINTIASSTSIMYRNSLSIATSGSPGIGRSTHLPAASYRTAKITMSEFIFYPSNKNSSSRLISANINKYYSIHGSNDSAYVTTWYDQSGNGRNATQTSASSQPMIVSNGSLNMLGNRPSIYFNGVTFISSPYNTGTTNELYFVTQTTDTMYLYPNSSLTMFGFVGQSGNSNGAPNSNYGSPQLYSNGSLKVSSTRNDVYLSLNGYKLVLHKNANMSSWGGSQTTFGNYAGGGYEYTGNLSEWLIYPTLQGSQSQIESNINNYYSLWDSSIVQSGLVMNLDASFKSSYLGSGTTWYDISSSGNNGTLTNSPTFSNTNGGQISFNGTNQYVVIPDSTTNRFGNQFSMSLSFYWDGVSRTNNNLFSKRNASPYNQYGFVVNNGDPYNGGTGRILSIFLRTDMDNGDVLLTYDLGTTPRNIIATVVIDVNSQKLFINGTIVANAGVNLVGKTFNVTGRQLAIGAARDNASGYFNYANAKIYSAQLYNRSLTDAEILQNFNATKSRFGL